MAAQPEFHEHEVTVRAGRVALGGMLTVPASAGGIIIFAHGSGSSRFSPRNRQVATRLNNAGFATLLFDLLTPDEEAVDSITGHMRFDVLFLAERLIAATAWIEQNELTRKMRIGYFGASTGAAAALLAATELPRAVEAVVSRGGRADMAGEMLKDVTAPTLLIVGSKDLAVIELNKQALAQLNCVKQMEIVQGATHLFEEAGALEAVADLAAAWFHRYLGWSEKRRESAS
ncbi:MAG TPA: dienelactone hydrolase family protein [Candidatus Obscuribacterales bacterium]